MIIKIEKIEKNGIHGPIALPIKGSKNAACFDIVAHDIEEIDEGKVIVHLGFKTEIPKGYKGIIVPRSSFTHKGWIMQNSPAQIDSDYRGEWMLKFEAIPSGILSSLGYSMLTYPEFPYNNGDRIAQVYFQKVEDVEFVAVLEGLKETKRGSGGFGSTGNKIIV